MSDHKRVRNVSAYDQGERVKRFRLFQFAEALLVPSRDD
jgi:hypothetical protein